MRTNYEYTCLLLHIVNDGSKVRRTEQVIIVQDFTVSSHDTVEAVTCRPEHGVIAILLTANHSMQ